MFHKPPVAPQVCMQQCCAKINSVKGRKGGDHLAVYNYIIHLVSFIARSGGDQRVKSDKKSLDWGLDDINCLSFILI